MFKSKKQQQQQRRREKKVWNLRKEERKLPREENKDLIINIFIRLEKSIIQMIP